MKMFFFMLLTVQVLSSLAQAQFIAGNHGEGVLLSQRVYLRDLHLYNQKDNLHFGPVSPIPEILLKMNDFDRLPLTQNQKDLLINKLTDIEMMAPCLGKILADMIYSYSWNFTLDVFPVPTENQEVSRISEGERVIVAKRFYSEVLIQKNYWDKMPDGHKVALMIHEVMYAMLTPISFPHVPGAAIQDVNIVRGVISNLFMAPSVYTRSKFRSQLRYFDVDPGITCEEPASYSAHFAIGGSATFPSRRSDAGLTRDLTLVCKKAAQTSSELVISVPTNSYKIQERTYKAFDGINGSNGMGQQTWNRICPAKSEIKTGSIYFTKDIDICVSTAKSLIFNWTDPLDYSPSTAGCL